MTNNITDVLDAISAANEAVKRIPELESTISTTETKLRETEHALGIREYRIHELEETKTNNLSQIETLKKELDEARFRELVAQEDAEKTRTQLRNIITVAGGLVPVAEPVKPVEEPKVEETLPAPAPQPEETKSEHGPYHNQPYSRKPSWMSDMEWKLDGGSTPEDWELRGYTSKPSWQQD